MGIVKFTTNGIFRGYITYPVIRTSAMNTPVGIDKDTGRLFTSTPSLDSIGAASASTVYELKSQLNTEIKNRANAIDSFANNVSDVIDDFTKNISEIQLEPLKNRVGVLENFVDMISGSSNPLETSEDLEVRDARRSWDNIEYDSLGSHIRNKTFDIKILDVQEYEVCEWGDTFAIQHQLDRLFDVETNAIQDVLWKKGTLSTLNGSFIGDADSESLSKASDFIKLNHNVYKVDINYVNRNAETSTAFTSVILYNSAKTMTRLLSNPNNDGSYIFTLEEGETYIRVCAPFLTLNYFRIYPATANPYERCTFTDKIWYNSPTTLISKSVNDVITELYSRVEMLETQMSDLSNSSFSEEARTALLDALSKVSWPDNETKTNTINELRDALEVSGYTNADTSQY